MTQDKMVPFNQELVKKMNNTVLNYRDSVKLELFEKAYGLAAAVQDLKVLLTPEYMAPIMNLQGLKLGFRTDKDAQGGYGMDIVRNCMIEATLLGLQVVGNQFNILAGNTYVTKEGLGYLLGNTEGLKYRIVPGLPKVNGDKTGAAVTMSIKWSMNGGAESSQELEVPVRMNNGMGLDAILGKATRKARAWLYNNLNDCEIGDGDIEDGTYTEVKEPVNNGDTSKSMDEMAAKLEGNSGGGLFKDEK